MRFLTRLFNSQKRHADTSEGWSNFLGDARSATGISVNPDTAMRSSAVLSCVRVLAETVAGLPFITYRRTANGRERDTSLSIFQLLQARPNRYQTAFEFREMMMAHCLLRGNAYAQKVLDNRGNVTELVPLNPTRVTPILTLTGDVVYEVKTLNYETINLRAEDVFHLKGLATDGIVGVSPIGYARETVGLALAAEEFGARLFANDAKPGGILEHPGKLSDEAHNRLKQSWQTAHSGLQNAHKVAVLEEGMRWQRIGVSNTDSQFIESRKFQIEEIARIFRVPPHLIGHLEHATFSNIEHQALDFVQHTLLPWLRRWEQAITSRLFSDGERQTHYCEFLIEGLLRGDTQSRYSAYAVGRQWGWLSADDVRRLENMEPLPNQAGEKYLIPLNMIDAAAPLPAPAPVAEPMQQQRAIFLNPIIEQLVEKYAERVARNKKSVISQETIIIDGLLPTLRAYLNAAGKPGDDKTARAVASAFVEQWHNGTMDTLDSKVDGLILLLNSVEGMQNEQ
ncbi:COG4695 Phage-related protein [uncultured Caudovirales phage]|uniref:COG4695 Phage-related protein n=1 Tax=uncultured Caudovirales phage TaxID=2100421 RepID=A0A6J5SY33_9CAUD|nr:COG4695 Phage-related protein [uncultured Caudovirales phage]